VLLLALDTSSTVRVALHDGDRVLARVVEDDPRRHTELLAPAVAEVLDRAGRTRGEVTHVVTGTGPAPFTGLRVGVVTALVLAEALRVPVGGVCSLDALAATAIDAARRVGAPLAGEVVAATDAKRREVHWARYVVEGAGEDAALRGWRRLDGPHVTAPASLPPQVATLPAVGAGAGLYGARLHHRADLPNALDPGLLAALAVDRLRPGAGLDPAEPLYLRRPDAAEPGPAKPVS